MKSKYKKTTTTGITSGTSKRTDPITIETMAIKLDQLAKQKLRNGCLGGCLRSREDEIRQDAILLALRWHARGQTDDGTGTADNSDWNPSKAIAHALRIMKVRYARQLSKDKLLYSDVITAATITCMHPAYLHECELPTSHRQAMTQDGIALAVRSRLISPENACVAELVLCDGDTASEAAARLGCHRSAIYQHLDRTRAVLRNLISNIEIPFSH